MPMADIAGINKSEYCFASSPNTSDSLIGTGKPLTGLFPAVATFDTKTVDISIDRLSASTAILLILITTFTQSRIKSIMNIVV